MDDRVVKFRVGVMVLATLIIAGILVLIFGKMPTFVGKYKVYAHFAQAPGVAVETPVRKSGILIGRVNNVEFSDDGGVLITLEIDDSVRLPRNEVPVINSSMLGDSVVQFVRQKDSPASAESITPGDYVQGRVGTDPLEMLSSFQGTFDQAVASVSSASDDIGDLARNLNNLVGKNEEQISRIVNKTELALDQIRTSLDNMQSVLGDKKIQADLRDSIARFPQILDKTNAALNEIENTFASADRTFKGLEKFTTPLGQKGEAMVNRMDSTVAKLDELLGQFTAFGQALNEPNGTLGKLINEPDLYQNLNQVVLNVECLTRQLKPILADARVFTDKIARDPGVIGVSGALKKRAGIK